MSTRYWINGTSFCCGDGEIDKDNAFVFYDSPGTIFNGYHFATKQEAFKDYCDKVDEKIENLKDQVEVLRSQL